MDERDVLGDLANDWKDIPGDDAGDVYPECMALVRFLPGWRFEPSKFPPKNFTSGHVGEPIPQLTGRVKILRATALEAVGGRPYIRLDFPPKGYDPEAMEPDVVEISRGRVKRLFTAAVAPGAKGEDAKKAAFQAAVAEGAGVALRDKEALVKITQYTPAGGTPRNQYRSWYPATPENVAKYLGGAASASGDGTSATAASASTDV